jgi:RND family efflux transporter MFP subunit|uniref:Efflux RND transporter periplasmic adaptor subunit n=1 Tax=Desulfomonile tiedjei TaxID=2358 RepID=A0A7C4ESP9_9BACT
MPQEDLSRLRIGSDERTASSWFRRRKRFTLTIAVAVALCALAAILGVTDRLRPALPVSVAKAAFTLPSRALTELNASGYVVAQRKAAVSSKATGRIHRLFIEEGKVVKKGDVLAQLENEDLAASLEEARASLRVARAVLNNAEAELADATLNYNRLKALKEASAISEQAFDAAEARYKKAVAGETQARFAIGRAEASLKLAEVNLEYSYIRAPFDGVILTKNADEGEIVAPFGAATNAKAAVASMADLGSLMVEVDVSEASLEKVRLGGAVEIRLDALPNERFTGTVHTIVPTADRSKATVLTKIKFDALDPRILPEMSAKAAFLSRALREDERAPALAIPAKALVSRHGSQSVFLVNDGRAHSVAVQTGRQWGDLVEIVSGLKEGDLVVTQPIDKITDGRRLQLSQ